MPKSTAQKIIDEAKAVAQKDMSEVDMSAHVLAQLITMHTRVGGSKGAPHLPVAVMTACVVAAQLEAQCEDAGVPKTISKELFLGYAADMYDQAKPIVKRIQATGFFPPTKK